jgi:uncharacterized protein (DUF488 family)
VQRAFSIFRSATQCILATETPAHHATTPIFTIGHGNRSQDEFLRLLASAGIRRLVDVRAFPGSRRHPQFGRAALETSLPDAGIEYLWEGEALGGRRRARADSPHVALRNASFRAYADHMQTEAFRAGVERLIELSTHGPIAIMCAERLPWQCHRYMISDYLVALAIEVRHLIDQTQPREHRLRTEARVSPSGLIYDAYAQGTLDMGSDPDD